jgi:hypothetical protein
MSVWEKTAEELKAKHTYQIAVLAKIKGVDVGCTQVVI